MLHLIQRSLPACLPACLTTGLLLSLAGFVDTPAHAQICPSAAWIRVSHDSRGDDPMTGTAGPTWDDLYSYKAITERAGLFYGGVRAYSTGAGPRNHCELPFTVDIRATGFPFGLVPAVAGLGGDFELMYVLDHKVSNPPLLAPVIPIAGSPDYVFEMPVDQTDGAVLTAARGTLVLDMRTTFPSDPIWEPPENYRAALVDATGITNPPGQQTFQFGTAGLGPAWAIQDSCESASLFQYGTLPGSPGVMVNCIQLATEFHSSVSATPQNCPVDYFATWPVTDPNPYAGTTWHTYVGQNSPGAASEVVMEGSWIDLLLGHMDANASLDNQVAGDFQFGLASSERIDVHLTFKDSLDWIVPAGCTPAPPPSVGWYATPDVDFEVWEYVKQGTTNFQCGGSPPLIPFDYTWRVLPTAHHTTGRMVYTISFEDDNFYEALKGIRLKAVDDGPGEDLEIAHMEIYDVDFVPASGEPIPGYTVGWSKAFRMIIAESGP